MKADNPFDKHLEAVKSQMPTHLKNVAIDLVDQMDLAKKITDTVFEGASTPELTIQVYDRLIKELVRETD
ncbi:hypothetical protein [Pseudoalteromonas marina]|uniref:hypothetical protein n=1 Tax=Pseudoalteromonas marina TaxID=267375 RepID=UPI0023F4D452|nr:hypothetical protein [Pseudoalteromonas marina]